MVLFTYVAYLSVYECLEKRYLNLKYYYYYHFEIEASALNWD